ncbi:phd and ring finger domain protein [Niveomyces insectorum RCEF 264]|uniref:Phd and ring finger domain protein n=1 Tax=Niveomyces insectorum RCEF 264 TaxID=1081102 RepID=A0A167MAH9_9HYPO|nr:phd and ring finger domain protein [Niveomyces insectorum RCEF 264]
MAEQCIVCLDTLLHHAAGPPPPPPPLPDEGPANSSSSSSNSASASASTSNPPNTTEQQRNHAGPFSTPTAPQPPPSTRKDAAVAADDLSPHAGHTESSHDDDHVAVIHICGHTLHDTCLREWTAKANSCPICRQSFHLVNVYDKIGGTLLSTYTVEDKKQVAEFDPQAWLDEYAEAEEEDVSTPCPVCNLADHEEVLLLCDGCDTPYHTHCIGLDSVPEGAWFCMECVDLFGHAVQTPSPGSPTAAAVSRAAAAGRRAAAHSHSHRQRARNDFFPRTRQTMRRARRRARSDEWQGAWGQITGRIWDALNIDLDHDEDEALEEYRRVERLRDNERREFERWQERLDIARRLGAQDVFERNIPTAILHHAGRQLGPPSTQLGLRGSRGQTPAAPQQTHEERQAWGDFEKARECEQIVAANTNNNNTNGSGSNSNSNSNSRKRKSRSVTSSPVEPPPEPERKLKRPRTRRIGALNEVASSSKASSSSHIQAPGRVDQATSHAGVSTSTSPPLASAAAGSNSASASNSAADSVNNAHAPLANDEPPSFLSSLLKEVEMSAPSDDENIRSLFGDPRPPAVDPSSPVGSSPAASAYNSPRAMSTTPPPQHKTLRPSSPTLLSSHILPVYPPANYSPTRPAASPGGGSGGGSANGAGMGNGDNSDSESSNNANANANNAILNGSQQRSPTVLELRQPRPRRMPTRPAPRSLDSSPTRHLLPLEMKESISSIVRTALKPHWKSSQLTADQYAAINRDVSRKLYDEVTNPAAVDTEARRLWEQKANREVERAVADLRA